VLENKKMGKVVGINVEVVLLPRRNAYANVRDENGGEARVIIRMPEGEGREDRWLGAHRIIRGTAQGGRSLWAGTL